MVQALSASSDQEIIKLLASISTSNNWSVLDSVLKKINIKLKSASFKTIGARELGQILTTLPEEYLMSFGIFVTSFGLKFAPIVCINPAFGRNF